MSHRRLTALALCTTLALAIYAVESAIPPLVPIPGIKLGLANIVTLILLKGRRPCNGRPHPSVCCTVRPAFKPALQCCRSHFQPYPHVSCEQASEKPVSVPDRSRGRPGPQRGTASHRPGPHRHARSPDLFALSRPGRHTDRPVYRFLCLLWGQVSITASAVA